MLNSKSCVFLLNEKGSVAEWSKALVLGTSPKGRGFESHHCQIFYCNILKRNLETPGIEPGTSRMRSERSTTELHPPLIGCLHTANLAPWP